MQNHLEEDDDNDTIEFGVKMQNHLEEDDDDDETRNMGRKMQNHLEDDDDTNLVEDGDTFLAELGGRKMHMVLNNGLILV